MLFAQIVDRIAEWGQANLPLVIGAGVALGVLWGVLIFRRKGIPGLDPEKLAAESSSQGNPRNESRATNWEPPEYSYADRRAAVRRDGQPVRVIVAAPSLGKGAAHEGYVLDRSTGGLKLALKVGMAVGGSLQVRAAHAPDTIGFVAVIVRSCRQHEDHFEVGCEFEKTPPWNVLLLFG
ncbi:MAG TPA: PilZ domain-containing protein [Gemmata sp.]|nr:PilZ domain-containing protein [Gemmata sp.]